MTFKISFGQTTQSTNRTPSVWLVIFGLLFGGTVIVREFRSVNKLPPTALSRDGLVYTPSLAKAERASRVDETCASLPKPEKFEFVSKTAPTETDRFVSIAYTYRSSRAASEIYPSFILWFTQNGWTDNKTIYERLEYSKGMQTVWLAPYHMKEDGDFFTVSCTEWKEVSGSN